MTKTLDRIDLMRLFVRIAETGSLSAAGRALGLSQPSVSRQLRTLEAELGAQLMMRSTHDLTLTEAGQGFLADARRLIAEWDSVAERLRMGRGGLEGSIRAAAPTALGQTVLADLAGRFLAAHPGIRLEWLVTDAPGDLVAQGIDLWLRVGPIADQSLIVRDLWRIERVIVAARALGWTAMRPEDLAPLPALVLGPYVGQRIALTEADGSTFVLEPRAVFTSDNIFAVERLTRAAQGYAILPIWLVDPAIAEGTLVRLCPGWMAPPLTLSLAYPQSRYRPARVTAFIEHLRAELPKSGAGISGTER